MAHAELIELLLFIGGFYVCWKVGIFALGAAIDVLWGGVKVAAAAALIFAVYSYATSAGIITAL